MTSLGPIRRSHVEVVCELHPTLGEHGFGNGLRESLLERIEEIQACVDLFRLVERSRVNRSTSSYRLKHAVQERPNGLGLYIPNGAAIVAGILLGFDMERDRSNAYFGMSRRSLHRAMPWHFDRHLAAAST